MKHFLALAKVQYFELVNPGKSKLKKAKGPVFLLLIGALVAYIGYIYSETFYDLLMRIGEQPVTIIPMMVGVAFFGTILYSFYTTGNSLYSTKDYDMLSAMPIKTVYIVASKLLSVLFKQTAIILLVGVPSVIVYGNKSGAINNPDFYLLVMRCVIMILFSGFLGTAISVFVGSFISILFSRLKHKNILQIVFMSAVLIGFLIFFYVDGGGFIKMANVISHAFFIRPLFMEGINNWLFVLLVVAIGIVAVMLIVWFVTVTYAKFNALLLAKKTNKKFRLKNYSKKSLFSALYKKEMGRLFTCPVYALNTIISVFISVIAVIMVAILFNELQRIVGTSLVPWVIMLLPAFYSFMYCLSPTTIAAVSLEGRALWFIKSCPIPLSKLFNAKILLQLTFALPCSIICSVIFILLLGTGVGESVLIAVTGFIFSAFGAVTGLFINLLFPKFDYESETKVVKNSLASFIQVMIAMGLTAVFSVLVANINGISENPLLYVGIADVVITVTTAVLYSLIMTNGKKRFKKA